MTTKISLDDDAVIVLFEMLTSKKIEDQLPNLEISERNAIWLLEGSLEKVLVQPLSPNYEQALNKARDSLVKRFGK